MMNEIDRKAVSMQFSLYREGVIMAEENHPELDEIQRDIFAVAYSRDHMGVPTRFLIGADGKPLVQNGKVMEAKKGRVASAPPAENMDSMGSDDHDDLADAREMAFDNFEE